MPPTKFCERLAQGMELAGFTDESLAVALGMTRGGVNHWLNSRREPGNANLTRLAEALNVRVAWLAFGDGEMREGDAPAPPPTTPDPTKRRSLPPPSTASKKRRAPKKLTAKPGPRKATPRSSAELVETRQAS